MDQVKEVKEEMKKRYEMSDLGLLHYFLGLQIDQQPGHIFLSQEKYATDLLNKFGLKDCNASTTPMQLGLKLEKGKEEEEDVQEEDYRSLIGSLIYLTNTRPDIEYATAMLSRFVSHPKTSHLLAAKRVLRYIQGTKKFGIIYRRETSHQLTGFSDLDRGGCTKDRKSTSGHVFLFGNKPISWSSRKQSTVALSSTEAEYIALCPASCEAIWLQLVLQEISGEEDEEKGRIEGVPILCDNQSSIALAKNPVFHNKSKHIELKFHYIREMIEKKKIQVQFCPTDRQLADILTKPLGRHKFLKMRDALSVVDGTDQEGVLEIDPAAPNSSSHAPANNLQRE